MKEIEPTTAMFLPMLIGVLKPIPGLSCPVNVMIASPDQMFHRCLTVNKTADPHS